METRRAAALLPNDQHNLELEQNVHPIDWTNPTPRLPYHLVVIGAGTAGLVAAAGAAGLGARVALVERELMGGDCLNVGCVPSKALIGSARAAADVRSAGSFGIDVPERTDIDFSEVMQRMRRLRAKISPADSAKRFTEMGVDVYFGRGQFVDDQTVSVVGSNGRTSELKFKKAVIATGARASVSSITGIDSVKYLTNETLFSLTELPRRFAIVGAGPIGAEMAQSFARMGSEVFLIDSSPRILSREDDDAATIVQKRLESDGVNLLLGGRIQEVSSEGERIQISGTANGGDFELVVNQLLLATGRVPNTGGLNLEAVNVKYDQRGVNVDEYLRTTNRRIFAAGDICSEFKFTHAADFQARIVIQNALFALGPLGRKKTRDLVIPWATYTSPEVAHVGMYASDARKKGMEVDTYFQKFQDVDRAILDGDENGFVKVHTKKGTDSIVGATVVARNAGDLISEICLAMTNGLGLAKIGATIHPYPTQADAIRKLGDQFNKTKLTSFSKRVLGLLLRLNVGK